MDEEDRSPLFNAVIGDCRREVGLARPMRADQYQPAQRLFGVGQRGLVGNPVQTLALRVAGDAFRVCRAESQP